MKALYSFLLIAFFSNVLIAQYDENKEKVFTSIEEAMQEDPLRVYYLDLKQQDLTAFPKEILQFEKLIHLNLAHNKIENLEGVDLSFLKDLKEIVLYDNKFRFFPYEILDQAKELHSIDLGENDLKEINEKLNQLQFIENIDLSGNRISKVSKNIKLPFLKTLNIERNYLNEFPEFIFHSQKLLSLNLYGNNIEVIPLEVNVLSKIKHLNIGDNPIKSIDSNISLRKLKTLILDWVDLSDRKMDLNIIEKASSLEILSMEHCSLSEIPEEVYNLRKLEEFSVLNNELITINDQIIRNKKLSKIWIGGNKIAASDIVVIKQKLKRTEIIEN